MYGGDLAFGDGLNTTGFKHLTDRTVHPLTSFNDIKKLVLHSHFFSLLDMCFVYTWIGGFLFRSATVVEPRLKCNHVIEHVFAHSLREIANLAAKFRRNTFPHITFD